MADSASSSMTVRLMYLSYSSSEGTLTSVRALQNSSFRPIRSFSVLNFHQIRPSTPPLPPNLHHSPHYRRLCRILRKRPKRSNLVLPP